MKCKFFVLCGFCSLALFSKASIGEQKYHSSKVEVHVIDAHPESTEFFPTVLLADDQIVTYIAGTPVVSSPYLGERPAFDGSDYIVNISSINRDVRLMQQRRRIYRAYSEMGYPEPSTPIIALSGKVEPVGLVNRSYYGRTRGDLALGSSELDVAVPLNSDIEGFISMAYGQYPVPFTAQRVANSNLFLNMGFINIGNLDKTPFYFTAGQLYAPFGRFSSSMISPPMTMIVGRTKARPFILGYKSQYDSGPFAAVYGFRGDTTLGGTAVGGVNLGYIFANNIFKAELGGSFISSISNSSGLQLTDSVPGTTFGGFASPSNGSEAVEKIPGVDVYGNLRFDRYIITAEWVGATRGFRPQDLSYNGYGAKPQAAQIEAGLTFMAWERPASVGVGYQWSKDTLALNLPKQRASGVFNISIWKSTVESIEFRHDIDYKASQFANGAAPPGIINANTIGSGKSADTLLVQLGVYF